MGWVLAIVFFILWIVRLNADNKTNERDYRRGRADVIAALRERLRRRGDGRLDDKDLADVGAEVGSISPHEAEDSSLASVPIEYADVEPAAYAATPVRPAPVVRVVTPEERHAATLRNLNTVLYAASFLIVAAAAVFVFTAGDPALKLATLLLVTAAFYGGGLILHARSSTLQPAATAFVGTGLAILPFAGIALSVYGGVPGGVSWLLVSIVGLIMFYIAAMVLRSGTVAYLTLGFVLSLCLSVVNVGGVGFVWYFVSLIIVSTVMALISFAFPGKVPALFSRPVSLAGQAVVPLTVLASLFVSGALSVGLYELIFSAAALSYLTVWLQRRTYRTEIFARIAVHAAFVTFAVGLATSAPELGLLLILISLIHAALGLLRPLVKGSRESETIGIAANMAIIFAAAFFAAASPQALSVMTTALVVIGALGLAAALRFRDSVWGYVSLGVSLVVPFVAGRGVLVPPLDWRLLGGFFLAMAGLACAVSSLVAERRRLVRLCAAGFIGYAVLALVCTLPAGSLVFGTVATVVLALLVVIQSRITRAPWADLIAALLLIAGSICTTVLLNLNDAWKPLLTAFIGAGLVAGLLAYDLKRAPERVGYVTIGLIVALTIGAAGLADGDHVVSLVTAGVFLLAAIGVLAIKVRYRPDRLTAYALTTAYYLFGLLFVTAAMTAGSWWNVAGAAIAVVLVVIGSYVDRARGLLIVANLALLYALNAAVTILNIGYGWDGLIVAGVFVGLMLAADTVYGVMEDPVRQWYVLGSLWAVAGWAWLTNGSLEHPFDVIAALVGLVGGLSVLLQGYETRRRTLLEAGIYISTLAAQWAVARLVPDLDLTLYAYWWAVTIIAVGLLIRRNAAVHVAIGLALVTAVLGIYALAGREWYALAFLAQHVVYIAIGFVFVKRWIIWWGIAATIVGVLYFLRSYTYLWLGLLGLLLIGFVVWRLAQTAKK